MHYFHQVDDPYSHLAVQMPDVFQGAYEIPFRIHLVSKPAAAFQGSSEHFDAWAVRDTQSVAADYGTVFSADVTPNAVAVQAANDILAPHLYAPDFATTAVATGEALWSGALSTAAKRWIGETPAAGRTTPPFTAAARSQRASNHMRAPRAGTPARSWPIS